MTLPPAAVFRALLSHWRRRPLQLLATVLGLALATALWSGVQALNDQARLTYDRAATVLGGATTERIVRRDGGPIALETYGALRRAGWAVSPVLQGRWRFEGRRYEVIGVDPITAPGAAIGGRLVSEALAGEDGVDLADFIQPPYRAYAAPPTVAELEAARPSGAADDLPAISAVDGLPEGALMLDIGAAQALLKKPGEITQLVIDPDAAAATRTAPLDAFAGGALQLIAPESDSDLERLTDSFHLNLTAFGLLAFVVGLFIVHSAIGLAFEQRLPIFRTLRAIGVSARTLGAALALELLGLALAAGVLGVALGYLTASALLPGVAASLRGLYGARIPGELSLSADWWLLGIAVSLLGAGVAAAQSFWKAFTMPALDLGRPEAWAARERRARVRGALAAIILVAAALGLYWAGGGLVGAFGVMAAGLLGAALLLPVILSLLLGAAGWLTRRLRLGPVWEWFWADGRQQLPGLSLALMALMLALAASVGVGSMVSSFRITFVGWIDQRLAAEVYLSPRSEAEAGAMTSWLEARPDVSAVLPVVWVQESRDGWPYDLMGVQDHSTYRRTWPMLGVADADVGGVWDDVRGGAAALASEQFLKRQSLAVGDAVDVPTPDGPWRVRLVAAFADYGNPEGQLVVSLDALRLRRAETDAQVLQVRADPADAEALTAAARDAFGLDESRAIDQATLKRFSKRVFENTFIITDALAALTLGVAAAALFVSLLTLSGTRLGQLAPVWAVGASRGALMRLEIAKALMFGLLTAALAVPVGVACAWALVALVNVEAFGWRLPLYHFPLDWLRLAAVATALALCAAAPALLKLRRAQAADLVRVFANDR